MWKKDKRSRLDPEELKELVDRLEVGVDEFDAKIKEFEITLKRAEAVLKELNRSLAYSRDLAKTRKK